MKIQSKCFALIIILLLLVFSSTVYAGDTDILSDIDSGFIINRTDVANSSEVQSASAEYVSVNIGDTYNFSCSACEDAALISSNSHVASFAGSNHILTAQSSGLANITTVCPVHGRRYYKISVSSPKLSLNHTSASLFCGCDASNTLQLETSARAGASLYVTWTSSDKSIATVSTSGKVTARSSGTAIITASANDLSSSCVINVTKADITLPASSINLSPKGAGSTCTISPLLYGPSKKVSWASSNTKVATVSNGRITARAIGTATISATYNNISRSLIVNVVPQISLDQKEITIYRGIDQKPAILRPYFNGKPAAGSWSSADESIVTIDSSGLLVPHASGTTTVCFYNDTSSDSCIVTVKDASIKLDTNSLVLDSKGDNSKYSLTATLTAPDNTKIKWTSSDKKVVSVDGRGRLTAKGIGKATVSASIGSITDAVNIEVVNTTISDIPSSITLTDLGEQYQLLPIVTGSDNTVTYSSSNTNIATVSGSGIITGHAKGSSTITVFSNGISSKCKVTVNTVNTILNKDVISLNTSTYPSEKLKATVTGPNKKCTWSSSNENIATVDDKGIVRAISKGSAIITVSANDKNASCTVCVSDTEDITGNVSISLDKNKIVLNTIGTNTCEQIYATVTGTKETVAWYSANPNIAYVSQNGVVQCVNKGSTYVYASCGNQKAKCSISVVDTQLHIQNPLISLNLDNPKKNSASIKAVVRGVAKDVQYTSLNEHVATVTNGTIHAVDEGSATIVASANGLTALCDVNVTNSGHCHSYVSSLITAPSCTATGTKRNVCQSCHDEYEETIPLTDHTYDKTYVRTPPTCTLSGTLATKCKDCDYTILEDIPSKGHSWNSPVISVSPTCTLPGRYTYTCSREGCEASQTSPIDALGHNYSDDYTIDVMPTCTEVGFKSRHCTNYNCQECCDNYLISPAGHSYDSISEDNNGVTDGYIYKQCGECNNITDEQYYIETSGTNVTITPSGYYECSSLVNIEALVSDDYIFDGFIVDGIHIDSDITSYIIRDLDRAHTIEAIASLRAVTATAYGYAVNYDGLNHSVNVITDPADATIMYSLDGTTYSAAKPSFTDAGTYTVYYMAIKNGYQSYSGICDITINPIIGSAFVKMASFTYADNLPSAELNSSTNGTDNVVLRYKSVTEPDESYSEVAPTQVGDYLISATFPATTNYLPITVYDDFSIMSRSIEDVSIDMLSEYTYTGEDVSPIPSLTYSGNELIYNTDYICSYCDNSDIGTANVTITGIGNYTGSITRTYDISFVSTSLITGERFNELIKCLVSEGREATTPDNDIEYISFIRTSNLPSGTIVDENGCCVATYSPEDRTVTIHCNATSIYANSNSSRMFYNLRSLRSISGLDIIDTRLMHYCNSMFAYCGYDADAFNIDISTFYFGYVYEMKDLFTDSGYHAEQLSIIIPTMTGSRRNTITTIYGATVSNKTTSYTLVNTSAFTRYFTPKAQ